VEFRNLSGTDWKCATCLAPSKSKNTDLVSVPINPSSLESGLSALLSPSRSGTGFDDLLLKECKAFDSVYDNSVNSVIDTRGNVIDSCSNAFTSVRQDFGKGLIIAHCNINGIRGKFEEIKKFYITINFFSLVLVRQN